MEAQQPACDYSWVLQTPSFSRNNAVSSFFVLFGARRDNHRIFKLCLHLDAPESRRNAKRPTDGTKFVHRHKKRANMKRAAAANSAASAAA